MKRELLKYKDMKLDDMPDLKNRMPSLGGTIVLPLAFVKGLTDGEFIVMCNCDMDFRGTQLVMQLIKRRMLELGIDHSTSINKNEIQIKTN